MERVRDGLLPCRLGVQPRPGEGGGARVRIGSGAAAHPFFSSELRLRASASGESLAVKPIGSHRSMSMGCGTLPFSLGK